MRTDEEWNKGHIPQSLHFPLSHFAGALDKIARDQDLVIVCGSGIRASVAASYLLHGGFKASILRGGMHEWIHAHLPVEAGSRF